MTGSSNPAEAISICTLVNPWLHFGTTVHYSISARFRDHSTFKVDTYEKKLVYLIIIIVDDAVPFLASSNASQVTREVVFIFGSE